MRPAYLATFLCFFTITFSQIAPASNALGSRTKADEERISHLCWGICNKIRETGDLNGFPNEMEEFLIEHMEEYTENFSRNDANRNAKIVTYLNDNKNDIQCKNKVNEPRNYMVAAAEGPLSTALFFKFFLVKLQNPDVYIDINTITNGQTTLDFIDKKLNRSDVQLTISKLCRIRKMFTEKYGAVNTGNKVNTVKKCDDLFSRR